MIYADLITGFLGAGKTTFIRKYAAYWASKGQKVCVLENDYGAINVDVAFLENNEGLQLDTAMIVGGDGADAHKRRFKTKLITLAMSGYQRIIIEPSGIFDMDEFFDTMYEDPLESMYSIGNVIAIADAGLPDDLSEESDYILASEIADAGIVLISKASSYSASRIGKVEEHISSALSAIGCNRRMDGLFMTRDWAELDDTDMERIASCGYVHGDYRKMHVAGESVYTSLFFFGIRLSEKDFLQNVRDVMSDSTAGHIFRIKGFVKIGDGDYLQINATPDRTETAHVQKAQEVVIVIGEKLFREKIDSYFPVADYSELV